MRLKNYPKRIAIVRNYLPRICGIATFTSDLSEALAHKLPNPENIIAIAMDDIEEGYDYPERVKFEIRENVLAGFWIKMIKESNYIIIKQASVKIVYNPRVPMLMKAPNRHWPG